MNIDVTPLRFPAVGTLPLEIVERKGVGHPDTICDALVETISSELSRFYVERFGTVLHHNVDKALLCAGSAVPAFGGGEVIEPIEIYLAGRAVSEFGGTRIPVEEIAVESSRKWLRQHLSHLDPERHVRLLPRLRSTSPDLASLFLRGQEAGQWLANDTSFGVGFAPLDDLERIVLAVERALNSRDAKVAYPHIGEDVKVMGARSGDSIALTVACAFVGRHVASLDDYHTKRQLVQGLALETARAITGLPLDIAVNAADQLSPGSVYLTVTGLSAEAGDDGQVGRGNRVNGLITPYRPMSLEAAAGKNPVAHVGKLYNVMASRVADAVVREASQVREAYCYLLSRIGSPIVEPQVFELAVRLDDGRAPDAPLTQRICEAAREEFLKINTLWREAIKGTLQVW